MASYNKNKKGSAQAYMIQEQNTPGICPNMSAKPPRVSLSSFILLGMKGLSRKKSILIPWDMGAGMKTPKSYNDMHDRISQ